MPTYIHIYIYTHGGEAHVVSVCAERAAAADGIGQSFRWRSVQYHCKARAGRADPPSLV